MHSHLVQLERVQFLPAPTLAEIPYNIDQAYLIRCASCGVSRLHVAGSPRRSYTVAGQVVCTDRFGAKLHRLDTGAVTLR